MIDAANNHDSSNSTGLLPTQGSMLIASLNPIHFVSDTLSGSAFSRPWSDGNSFPLSQPLRQK